MQQKDRICPKCGAVLSFKDDLTCGYHLLEDGYVTREPTTKELVYWWVRKYKEKYSGCGMADSFLALIELTSHMKPYLVDTTA